MLKGKKTVIRPLEDEDIDTLYEWYNDQEVNLWSSGSWPLNTMFNKEVLREKFLQESTDGQRFAVLNGDNNLIGTIGFSDFNIPARSATLFITIGDKTFWGKGYGTDALLTFSRFLFSQWNLHRLSLDTWDGNTRAIKAYEKIGFKIEGRQRQARYVMGEYHDAIIMGLLKEEFKFQL
ncbi:MAG: GNAT family N-acetyltransferase [Desulfitobacteriaceae bacterium]